MKHLYRPLLRPASFATLPRGLAWSFVEAPWDLADRVTLPRCETRHGLIATERALTAEECEAFDLQAMPETDQPTDGAILSAACRLHHVDGKLEIDNSVDAVAHMDGAKGAYVRAWIWVDYDAVRASDVPPAGEN